MFSKVLYVCMYVCVCLYAHALLYPVLTCDEDACVTPNTSQCVLAFNTASNVSNLLSAELEVALAFGAEADGLSSARGTRGGDGGGGFVEKEEEKEKKKQMDD